MRDGKYITEGKFSDFTMDTLIANMVGREITNQFPREKVPRGKKVLEVKHLKSGMQVSVLPAPTKPANPTTSPA